MDEHEHAWRDRGTNTGNEGTVYLDWCWCGEYRFRFAHPEIRFGDAYGVVTSTWPFAPPYHPSWWMSKVAA